MLLRLIAMFSHSSGMREAIVDRRTRETVAPRFLKPVTFNLQLTSSQRLTRIIRQP